jgi:hypothetical protein
MKIAATLLLLLCIGLGAVTYRQEAVIRQQHQQVQQLNEKLESTSKATALELQEKCAKQAREGFKLLGWDKHETASFSNHYNAKLNKCFLQIEDTNTEMTWDTVSDAFEGKVYAVLGLHGDGVRKCSVTLPSEEKTCHSKEEFSALVKQYME